MITVLQTWCSDICVAAPDVRGCGKRETPCDPSVGLGGKLEVWIRSLKDYMWKRQVQRTLKRLKDLKKKEKMHQFVPLFHLVKEKQTLMYLNLTKPHNLTYLSSWEAHVVKQR